MSFSWLLPLDGFQFYFLLRDSENDLYGASSSGVNLGTDHKKAYRVGGGGGGEVQKKIFAQGKIKWKKNHARQLILTNIHAMA